MSDYQEGDSNIPPDSEVQWVKSAADTADLDDIPVAFEYHHDHNTSHNGNVSHTHDLSEHMHTHDELTHAGYPEHLQGHRATEEEKQAQEEEAAHYMAVVHSFASYNLYTQLFISRAERNYNRLPESQKLMLPEMPQKIKRWRDLGKQNYVFIRRIVENEPIFFNPHFREEYKMKRPSDTNIEKVFSTLKQFVREWSVLGKQEREESYAPILEELCRRLPVNEHNRYKLRVVCPGSGLGRLPFEICRLGYASQGNEFSYFMLIASNFILNRVTKAEEFTIYPFIHTVSNWISQEDQFRGVKIPDVFPGELPPDADFSYTAGEFIEVYRTQPESIDAVCTCFFIDTANNIIDYIQTIYEILRPGGIWINLGPLLYHYAEMPHEMSIELNLEQVMQIVRQTGFKVENERMIQCHYAKNFNSMMTTTYNCAFFVGIKE